MIHPDDWSVLLRSPEIHTVMWWLIWLLLCAPVVIPALVSVVLKARDRSAPTRPLLWMAATCLVALSAYGVWAGLQQRWVQARCWRAGPEAVPDRWREYCERIPPQGVEGLYFNTPFAKE